MIRELLGTFLAQRQRECSILAWATFSGTDTPSLTGGHNVSSISDGGIGIWTITWSQAITAGTDYAVMGIGRRIDGADAMAGVSVQSATYLSPTSVTIRANEMAGDALVDINYGSLIAVGPA